MDAPTKEKPEIELAGGILRVMRGVEAVDMRRHSLEFVGGFDGPVLQIRPPHGTPILMGLELAAEVAEAITACISAGPAATQEELADRLADMGFTALPR